MVQKRNKTYAGGELQIFQWNFKFSIFSYGSSGDDGFLAFASEVASDVLHTYRFLISWASTVAIAVIVAYCLVQIVANLVVLWSRVLLDLPLGILSSLCGVLVQPLNLVFVQLGHLILWVVTSVLSGIVCVLTLVRSGVVRIDAQLIPHENCVVAHLFAFRTFVGDLWRSLGGKLISLYLMCIILPLSFLYNFEVLQVEYCSEISAILLMIEESSSV